MEGQVPSARLCLSFSFVCVCEREREGQNICTDVSQLPLVGFSLHFGRKGCTLFSIYILESDTRLQGFTTNM